ncbi:hypothetical protein [Dehalobacterium formicoaceticum]|uniref:hypothetical protein n=1 Tax=Dehalobacterium formicoaceticum TaxID=51515 RepID=UPI000B7F60A2|nr:hypothetical protein [Dehalobacterium formicoaceticum]
MNYIREAEERLRYYRELYASIRQNERDISRLIVKAGPKHLTAIAISEAATSGNGHDETINILYQIQVLSDIKLKTEKAMDEVNAIIKDISKDDGCELYGKLLHDWYIERKPKDQIGEEMHISERHVYRIKDRAIRKFAVRLFGIEALRAM